MAEARKDQVEALIANKRVQNRPVNHYGYPKVVTIDLELLAQTLVVRLTDVYHNSKIRDHYYRTSDDMIAKITALVDFAVAQTYNRLRLILQRYHPTMCSKLMNTRFPFDESLEFPAWLSSTLSCIGPCHISNGPRDTLILYATTAETMNNYGRTKPVTYIWDHYHSIMTYLRYCKVDMAPLNFKEVKESCYPTISPVPVSDGTWTLYGQVHSSHYECEDIARIFLVTDSNGVTPFQSNGTTIGYVDDPAVLNAIVALSAPPNIPPEQSTESDGRLFGGAFGVNCYGIKPAVAADGNKPAQMRGIYVVGRGVDRYYQCVLCHDIYKHEIYSILSHRLAGSD